MCSRFLMEEDLNFLYKRYNVLKQEASACSESNIKFPSTVVQVVRYDKEEKSNRLVEMKWGWKFQQSKTLLINARSENLFIKSIYSKEINSSRCIVPANAYYEWDHLKNKYTIKVRGSRLFSIAGLYKTCIDHNNESFDYVVIITKDADYNIMNIHNRMPLLLNEELEDKWLSGDELKLSLFEEDFLKSSFEYLIEKEKKNNDQLNFFDLI